MRAALLAPSLALQLLTILPVPLPEPIPRAVFPVAVALFPAAGLALGAAVGLFDVGAGRVLPVTLVSALDLVLLAVLTGALHLDGLADATDGLLGDLPRERRLDVMREPGVGTFGTVAIALVLLAEYGALAGMGTAHRVASLLAALVLSRWTMSVLLWLFPYARPEGVGKAFREGLGAPHAIAATVIALAATGALMGAEAITLALVTAAVALILGTFAWRRVGGCTGDVYGAAGELAFAGALVAAAVGR